MRVYELNIERDYTFISKLYEKIGNYKLMRINILRQIYIFSKQLIKRCLNDKYNLVFNDIFRNNIFIFK